MRVLHFLPVYAPAWQFGGPILSVSRLCEGLVDMGVEVHVITTNYGLPRFPIEHLGTVQNVNGVNVTYYPVDRTTGFISSAALVKSLPKHLACCDLIHLSSIWHPLGLEVQKAAHAAGVPVFQTLRGALGPYSLRRRWWKKLPYLLLKERPYLQRAAALHCTTVQEAEEISYLRLRTPIKLLPNPIDLDELQPNQNLRLTARMRLGILGNTPLLLVAGRLHHKKGLDLIPKVFQSLACLNWHILFVGHDEDRTGTWLKSTLREYGLSDRCTWLDYLPSNQMSAIYNAADLLLLPSRHENFGNVVVEALACGCSVLVSDRVGVSSSIQSCPGVTVLPRSVEVWTETLPSLLTIPRAGHLSSQWVSSYFAQSKVCDQAINHYKDILDHV